MIAQARDPSVNALLSLDGDRYFIDEEGEFEVIFKVTKAPVTPERPHGLGYSLVLLNANGERALCFDNAHAVSRGSGPGKKNSERYDHKHVGERVIPYEFKDAHTLIADFWNEVDKHLQWKLRSKRKP